jgi:GNAT superfamily N-acetyltransferase
VIDSGGTLSDTLLLRRACRFDAAALARLRAASLVEQALLLPHDAPAFERDAVHRFAALLRDDRIAAWLLEADGDVCGAACVLFWERLPYAEGALHAELAGVYVEPAYRRRGVARELCREAIAAARARSPRRIVVHPSLAGRALYRELGFVAGNEMRLGDA